MDGMIKSQVTRTCIQLKKKRTKPALDDVQ